MGCSGAASQYSSIYRVIDGGSTKCQEKEEGSKFQPQPEPKAEPEQEPGGAKVPPRPEEQPEEKMEVARGDQGAADSKSGTADSSSTKPKVPSRKPKGLVKSTAGKTSMAMS